MDTLSLVAQGFGVALQPVNLLYCFVGVFIGTRLQDGTEQRKQPSEVVVNVKAGATVVSTQVVPLP